MLSAKFLAFGLAAVSGSTDVSPVYLKCTFQYPNSVVEQYFKIDESNKKVTIGILKTGYIQKVTAEFAGDLIKFKEYPAVYHINRKNLSIIRYLGATMETKTGECENLPPPRRAL